MIGTESIPQRENRVDRIFHTALVGLQVHAQIASVGIRKQIGLYTRMIKCGIEHNPLVIIVGFNIYFRQIIVP